MFERFSDRARRVLVSAQAEARLLNSRFVGTEHLVLGLLHEEKGIAAQALERLGISLESVRNEVRRRPGIARTAGGAAPGGRRARRARTRREAATVPGGLPPFTPRAKKVLELAYRESLQLGHPEVDTEHLLFGMTREGEGEGVRVLVSLGADLEQIRREVIRLLSLPSTPAASVEEDSLVPGPPRCPGCGDSLLTEARYRVITVPPTDPGSGDDDLAVLVIYCNHCGVALGSLPSGHS